jgi:hypothetical protein
MSVHYLKLPKIKKPIKLRSIREKALFVSEYLMMIAGWLALVPLMLMDRLDKKGVMAPPGIGPAFGAWLVGFIIMLPVSGPLMLLGILIDRAFVVQPLREERMTKRQDIGLGKL